MTQLVAGQVNGTVDYYPQHGGTPYDPVLNGGSVTSVTIYESDGITEQVASSAVVKVSDGHYQFTIATALASPGVFPAAFVYNASNTGPVVTDTNETVTVEFFGGNQGEPPAFATAGDLGYRLKRVFDAETTTAVDLLLEDASDHLRGLLDGQRITAGSATVELKMPVGQRRVELPQVPVRSVSSVKVNGTSTSSYELVDHGLELAQYGTLDTSNHFPLGGSVFGYTTVEVTFSYGFTKVPGILRTWALTLASQALAQIEALGAIGAWGMASERIDDYAVNFIASGAAAEAYYVPDKVLRRLRSQFAGGSDVALVGIR